jgi:hypothetical protein
MRKDGGPGQATPVWRPARGAVNHEPGAADCPSVAVVGRFR